MADWVSYGVMLAVYGDDEISRVFFYQENGMGMMGHLEDSQIKRPRNAIVWASEPRRTFRSWPFMLFDPLILQQQEHASIY